MCVYTRETTKEQPKPKNHPKKGDNQKLARKHEMGWENDQKTI